MKKFLNTIAVAACLALLTSCGITTAPVTRAMQQEQLASGKNVSVAWKAPKPEWQCSQVATTSSNWSMDKVKGMSKMIGGGNAVLKEESLTYANVHHINADYIYLDVPIEVTLGSLNATALSDAHTFYYQCKSLPAAK